MHIHTAFLILFACLCLSTQLQAQISLENKRRLAIAEEDSVFQFDQWILPETFRVYADTLHLSEEQWTLNPASGTWSWNRDHQYRTEFDSLFIHYEYWPIDLPSSIKARELIRIDTIGADEHPDGPVEITRRPLRQQDLFGDTDLQRSGSLRRGVVLGTNQDLSLESGLNFDISGRITDDLEVVASLTDRSTPIQPDGTTQTLREFDQVYIRLMHETGTLQMGDVDMRLDQSNFAAIDRRLQGVDIKADLDQYGAYKGSAAVVRGQYREMQFTGEDGVQGPYRLTGADNEDFIIVLAGSERVYIDGQRMIRGEENDYVIDYGLGEITFTSNRIITDHTRITVDFQYLRDAYTRTVLAAEAEYDQLFDNRVSFGATVIREADNVNMSTQTFLSEFEREVLREAGDDPQKAVISGVDSVGFSRDADVLLYSKTDTTLEGETYQIFKHLPGDSSGVYRVQFSRLPDGEGDYRRVGRAANGILYEWAGPGMGNYMPERRLSRPMEQNMVALRSRVRASGHLDIFGEWAGSSFDQNRLSPIDNEDNQDMSFLAGMALKPYQTRLGKLTFDVRGRYEGENFAYFDRVREVEFDRRWNLTQMEDSREIRLEGTAGLALSGQTKIDAGAGHIERNNFDGSRGDFRIQSAEEGLPGIEYYLELVDSEDRNFDEKGSWLRQKGRADYEIPLPFGSIQPEIMFDQEERIQKHIPADTLLPTSFRFTEVGPGLFFQLSDGLRMGGSVRYRKDKGFLDGELADESSGITQRYILKFHRGNLFQTENTLGLRKRKFEEAFRLEQQRMDSRGVLVRSVTDYRPWNRLIDTQFLYNANTERRALLQEAFIEVGPELGQYVWIDLNEDGVQQIDEFFPEQGPNEGTFIKQLVPSDELFPVIALRARWRTIIDPSRIIDSYDAQYSDLLNFLAGIRWQSVIDINEENTTDNLEDIYLLRLNEFRDDSLTINGRLYIEQDVELFRNHTRRELRLTADRMLSQNQQASGVERRETGNLQLRAGLRITRRYRSSINASLRRSENESETFASRNFRISGAEIRPRFDIRWTSSVQTGITAAYLNKIDRFPDEHARVTGFTAAIDSRLHFGRRIQSTLRLERRNYKLEGGPSTSMGEFELTDGAGLGRTWSWSVQSDYRISDFLRASIQYDGRTVVNRRAIQTLRFTVNAVF